MVSLIMAFDFVCEDGVWVGTGYRACGFDLF